MTFKRERDNMKSGLIRAFQTDKSAETEGKAIVLPGTENEDGTQPTFYVARAHKRNRLYQKQVSRLFKDHQEEMRLGTMDDVVAEEKMTEAFLLGCVKGWDNVQDENGDVMPFSIENARVVFDALPELLEALQDKSTNLETYRMATREDSAKN